MTGNPNSTDADEDAPVPRAAVGGCDGARMSPSAFEHREHRKIGLLNEGCDSLTHAEPESYFVRIVAM